MATGGKAVRAATEKAARGKVPYVVSAFACGLGTGVCQLEIGDKGNEITDIPKPVEMMDIGGCTVTIDAIGTQRAIMDLIVGKGGHFCLQLKRNQPTAFEGVEGYFADQLERAARKRPHDALDEFRTVEKGHGRIETRTYRTLTDATQVGLALPDGWGHVRCLGMAVLEREVVGDPSRRSVETHYHVMDVAMGAERYAGLARGHWGQENALHHVLDVQFGEDACTARADNAISNLTLLRKVVFNIVRQVKGRKSTRAVMTDFMMDADLFMPFLYERVPVGVADGSISL